MYNTTYKTYDEHSVFECCSKNQKNDAKSCNIYIINENIIHKIHKNEIYWILTAIGDLNRFQIKLHTIIFINIIIFLSLYSHKDITFCCFPSKSTHNLTSIKIDFMTNGKYGCHFEFDDFLYVKHENLYSR